MVVTADKIVRLSFDNDNIAYNMNNILNKRH